MTCVDGTCMVAVKDHETFSHHGQADLCFGKCLKAWVDIYVKCARNQVDTGKESNALFLNWKEGKMSSSDFSAALTRTCRKASMIGTTHISGTLMRKSCINAVRNCNKQGKGSVDVHMTHREHTADKHYHLIQKLTNSAFAARQLAAIMHGSLLPVVSSHKRKDDSESKVSKTSHLLHMHGKAGQKKKKQEVFADRISRQSVAMLNIHVFMFANSVNLFQGLPESFGFTL